MKSVGEVEFVNGCAAMAESRLFGPVRACAGIVGGVDLRGGEAVEEVLEAHLRAGGARYKGVRSRPVAYDEDERILGAGGGAPQVLMDPKFRAGFKCLQPLGLSCDIFLFEPQLPELIDLARTFPDTQIVLNHMGTPLGVGRHEGQRAERFALWRDRIRTLSQCANVAVKLAGIGLPFAGFDREASLGGSEQLASQWRPYIETCIEGFGVNRCMFASNFPVDSAAGSYSILWNAFKRMTVGASESEKTALFSGTAISVYRLGL